MRDHAYLGDITPDHMAALLLELASQLHVERVRRMALEAMLVERGVIDAAEMNALVGHAGFVETTRGELDLSLRRLMRIMTAQGGAEGPLRGEAL
jgi:hypothetical protein